jgi:lysophospholipase L1-like esterase
VGGAAGTGGGTFNPCPANGTACIIMPFGDSITEGAGSTPPVGGYRVPLFQTALTNAKLITFVGRRQTGPTTVGGQPFPRDHEGYSGYTIDPGGGRNGISPLVAGAIDAGHPHIILLMIGTNDIDINLDLANAPTRLGALLDSITTAAPNALLVVATLVPATDVTLNNRVVAYNNAIPGVVQTRAAAGKHIVLVNMNAAFLANPNWKTALMWDALHPNDAGYAVMASIWYPAISGYLPGN